MGYTSINLHPESQKRLVDYYNGNIQNIPEDWEIIAHHMTINMSSMAFGPLKDYTMGELEKLCNQDQELKVVSYAMDDKVMAVGVETELPSKNKIKHITVAVNREAGGKPFLSNQLTAWESVDGPTLNGSLRYNTPEMINSQEDYWKRMEDHKAKNAERLRNLDK